MKLYMKPSLILFNLFASHYLILLKIEFFKNSNKSNIQNYKTEVSALLALVQESY